MNHDKQVDAEIRSNRPKNLCAKTRKADKPYEIWTSFDGQWKWYVLKKWQTDDNKPFARWFCLVKSPIVPEGEYGDTYVSDIKRYASRTYVDSAIA